MSWAYKASGLFASHPTEVEGKIRLVLGLNDIVAWMREAETEPVIVVTNVAGGSAISTIVRRAKAVISTIGGQNSHIVIVAKDHNLPCIVGASALDLSSLKNGMKIRMRQTGDIEVQDEA